MLLGPADLMAELPAAIEGADQLHRVLVGMLEASGQRDGAGCPRPEEYPRTENDRFAA